MNGGLQGQGLGLTQDTKQPWGSRPGPSRGVPHPTPPHLGAFLTHQLVGAASAGSWNPGEAMTRAPQAGQPPCSSLCLTAAHRHALAPLECLGSWGGMWAEKGPPGPTTSVRDPGLCPPAHGQGL